MKTALAVLALSLGLTAPAGAQELIAQYSTDIGPGDRVNSSGVPLRDVCSMIQQDRANIHRFGRPDPSDQWDPVFGSRDARSRIPAICRIEPGYEYLAGYILQGPHAWVWVRVYGSNGWPTAVIVREGAG